MKTLLTGCFLLVSPLLLIAQQKNPATIQDIKEKQKQAQEALNSLSPEQRKMINDMGMGTSVTLPPGTTNAQVSMSMGGNGVPARNSVLISLIPKITLTAATLPDYIKSLNAYIDKSVSVGVSGFASEVYESLRKNGYDVAATGNSAVVFWSAGEVELAVSLMGKACAADPGDADLLSNFSAMISMGGAPHRALPLLEYLAGKYPENTTILNNLGQAWFYLGETEKANTQLEKVVRAFAYHPQANYTQCLLLQNKGNTTKAIDKLQHSLQYSYSLDKLNLLRKLGGKPKAADMRVPFRPDPNPLGLKNFIRPEAPDSYASEIRLKADWDAFQQQLGDRIMQTAQAMQPYITETARKTQEFITKGTPIPSTLAENMYSKRAELNLNEMSKDGGSEYRLKKSRAIIDSLMKDYIARKDQQKKLIIQQNSVKADQETELAKKGEDIGYDVCVVEEKLSDWIYLHYNKQLEQAYQEYLHQLSLKLSESLYWKQFLYTQAAFEQEKLAAQKEWLLALRETRYISTYSGNSNCIPQEETNSSYHLADFDDLNCKYVSTLDAKICTMVFSCGRSSIEFDAGRLSGNFHFKDDATGNSHFVKGTLEATVIDKNITIGKGPLQAGATVKAGMGMEFTNRGIEDVYATGEASVKAGSNVIDDPAGVVGDPSVTISISGRMSLISGNISGAIQGFGK